MASPLRFLLTLMLVALALQARADTLAPYQIVSGDLPPFTVESGPNSPGALGALVRGMAKRLGEAPPIQFYPWSRALSMVGTQPRTLILPLTRTPEREANYRWLVKLYRQQFVFIALRGATVNLDSLDALRDMPTRNRRSNPHHWA